MRCSRKTVQSGLEGGASPWAASASASSGDSGMCLRSQAAAQQIGRLHGINAPEFFDQGLFDEFVDALLANQHLQTDEHELLVTNATIAEILHAARTVIDDKIRFALTPLLNAEIA